MPETISIGAVQGAKGEMVQALLLDFARRRIAAGCKLAGMVELDELAPSGGKRMAILCDISSGGRRTITQDLGASSAACNLDPSSLAEASFALECAIHDGLDLVVINKFGKQEALGGGFRRCFEKALAFDVPVLTGVNPAQNDHWLQFSGGFHVFLPPDVAAIDGWWKGLRRPK